MGHDGKISRMSENISEAKHKLRKELIARRADILVTDELTKQLENRLLELALETKCMVIGCHLPFGNEPPLLNFLHRAKDLGIKIYSPVAGPDGEMSWVLFDGRTKKGIFGFSEAVGEPQDPNQINLLIMPALAIDKQGNRLGRGGGYYDRALDKISSQPIKVAVVFDHEIVNLVPTESHDKAVDYAVSPSKTLKF